MRQRAVPLFRPTRPLPLPKACHQIVQIHPGRGDAPPKQESIERVVVWHTFLDAAELMPYNHPYMAKLARLAADLRYSPKTGQSYGRQTREPRHLTTRAACAERNDFTAPLRDENLDEPARLDRDRRWINKNAFYANIYPLGWPEHADYLHDVLDLAFGPGDNGSKRSDPIWRDAHVSAAAQWILYNGQAIFQEVLNPADFPIMGAKPLRLSLAEWRHCKEGFRGVGDSEGEEGQGKEEVKGLAARAARLMDAVEESMMAVLGPAVAPRDTEEFIYMIARRMKYTLHKGL
ncbi:hypothetical protein PG997_000218 [Apiospora hydei]|uniref:Uncharacterized protein n=1 Tax=Apiospora hydei TaxID=1337664 RepID=A0ABR1XA41_9PEZI